MGCIFLLEGAMFYVYAYRRECLEWIGYRLVVISAFIHDHALVVVLVTMV